MAVIWWVLAFSGPCIWLCPHLSSTSFEPGCLLSTGSTYFNLVSSWLGGWCPRGDVQGSHLLPHPAAGALLGREKNTSTTPCKPCLTVTYCQEQELGSRFPALTISPLPFRWWTGVRGRLSFDPRVSICSFNNHGFHGNQNLKNADKFWPQGHTTFDPGIIGK